MEIKDELNANAERELECVSQLAFKTFFLLKKVGAYLRLHLKSKNNTRADTLMIGVALFLGYTIHILIIF